MDTHTIFLSSHFDIGSQNCRKHCGIRFKPATNHYILWYWISLRHSSKKFICSHYVFIFYMHVRHSTINYKIWINILSPLHLVSSFEFSHFRSGFRKRYYKVRYYCLTSVVLTTNLLSIYQLEKTEKKILGFGKAKVSKGWLCLPYTWFKVQTQVTFHRSNHPTWKRK